MRASLLESRIANHIGNHRAALEALHHVEHQDPDFLGEIIDPLRTAYAALGAQEEMEDYLSGLLQRYDNTLLTIANAELVKVRAGDLAAIVFLSDSLHRSPSVRGVKRLIELDLAHHEGQTHEHLLLISNLLGQLLAARPLYCCSQCGFTGKSLHWQCPSCKSWSTVRPIQGLES